MKNSAFHTPDYSLFSDKHVRDLVWAIASPPLLSGVDFVSHSWFEEHYRADFLFFSSLDKAPDALHSFLKKRSTKRLGKYFEALYEFWFIHSPFFDLKLANEQVQDNERTVGEIDFLVYDLLYDEFFHFELAVKFYLQYEEGNSFRGWVGPNSRDRLDLKYSKLIEKQLRILETPAGKACVFELGLKHFSAKCIMKGYSFYYTSEKYTAGFHPLHLKGTYRRISEFTNYDFSGKFILLEKPDWFSFPLSCGAAMEEDALQKHLCERMAVLPNPFMILQFDEALLTHQRIMIVPDSWPDFSF